MALCDTKGLYLRQASQSVRGSSAIASASGARSSYATGQWHLVDVGVGVAAWLVHKD